MRRCFQYFSDLHLERKWKLPKIPQVADRLCLAGDIGYPDSELYQEFFKECSERYEHVFVVDGNHEWDNGTPCPKRFSGLKNVHLLNNSHVEHNDYVIIGTTLWTETVRCWEHAKALDYLTVTFKQFEHKPVIMISHHLPTWHLIAKHYQTQHSEQTLYRYASHMDYFFHRTEAPRLWICGHSHSIMQRRIGKTHCAINTFGETHSTKWCLDTK
jgi:hypothetical protein